MRIWNKHYQYEQSLRILFILIGIIIFLLYSLVFAQSMIAKTDKVSRQRISINEEWCFYKYDPSSKEDTLIYDLRPEVKNKRVVHQADAEPTELEKVGVARNILKSWILPTGNHFISNLARHYTSPAGNPGSDFPFVKFDFDDSSWEKVDLPHDWAVKGPFFKGEQASVGGSMGRLPSPGVAWYRKKLEITKSDAGKSIFLDIDGAMSYAMVWLNGQLAGGWPYGYASWRVDLTPYIRPGAENQLAIRLDNPPGSSRWYPGGGIYRNVWLIKTEPVHIGQWGTRVTARNITEESTTLELEITIDNNSTNDAHIRTITDIFILDPKEMKIGEPVACIKIKEALVAAINSTKVTGSVILNHPRLWGPPPTQFPHLYLAVTSLFNEDVFLDQYETRFGIRSMRFDPNKGIFINDKHIFIKGVNQHHDLGSLGAAFNYRAAERQLEILREMGCNAIRTAHNPPAPELLELTDRMGFLVIDEIFDVWERKKTPLDYHLIFPDWYEQNLRAFIRRDRNCPSVIAWSLGNEVGEQYTGEDGAVIAKRLRSIAKEEDPTRLITTAINYAKPDMPMPGTTDFISLNYQGEGIRNAPAYAGLKGIITPPLYPAFHKKFPNKLIISSENASSFSTRGTYLFPVFAGISAPVKDGMGGDPKSQYVSAYELYTADFGSSADKVFASLDRHPYVAGGFVWSGWDYLGEPTPYYGARSSYSGIIDLAGFKKDRFYLYQSRWRPDLPVAHILPHWNWPERVGKVTPVHVFTSGDEVELFLNGKSLGRKHKSVYEYRLRWDEVLYEPGILKAIAYKNGKKWAEDTVETTGNPARLEASADREIIQSDGKDLVFITVKVADDEGLPVPVADNLIMFAIKGPGEIIATDNGNPADFVPFSSHERNAFNGLALVIVRSIREISGQIVITAESPELTGTRVIVVSQ